MIDFQYHKNQTSNTQAFLDFEDDSETGSFNFNLFDSSDRRPTECTIVVIY